MHLVHSLAVLLFLSYHVLAAPAPQSQQKGRSFKVDRLRRGDYVADGPTALRNAYRKYHIMPTDTGVDMDDFEPVDTKSAVTSNNNGPESEPERNGSVSARSVQSDVAFVSPVTIGGQKIVMNFDTGSSDFWVMSSTTPAAAQNGHNVFNLSKSPTFEVMKGHSFEITYGDGSHAAGLVGTDKVDIGGITFPNQAIGIPLELSQSFIESEISNGLVGLGFQSLSTIQPEKQPTFFGNVAPTLDEPVLTALLKSDGVGEYEFGVVDHSKYQGQLVNVSVDASNGWWQFPSKTFSVGDGPYQAIGKSPSAIADTGTSLLMASPEVVESYYTQVPGSKHAKRAGGYIFPCNAELPSLSVFAGHVRAIIPGRMMNFSYVGTNRSSGEKLCFGGLQSNQGMPMQIFGDVFLKALFVVFDRRGPSLGLAVPSRY